MKNDDLGIRSKVIPMGNDLLTLSIPDKSMTSIDVTDVTTLSKLRKDTLDKYKQVQPFRVAIGKNTWLDYTHFDEKYNLREILNNEIVIEFDSNDPELVVRAIGETGINLVNAGITFEYWDHGGKSPHLHIHNLPIENLTPDKRALFKKLFIRKYVPLDYLQYVDFSLTGVHLIALEWANHWKGKYNVKKLIHTFVGVPHEMLSL